MGRLIYIRAHRSYSDDDEALQMSEAKIKMWKFRNEYAFKCNSENMLSSVPANICVIVIDQSEPFTNNTFNKTRPTLSLPFIPFNFHFIHFWIVTFEYLHLAPNILILEFLRTNLIIKDKQSKSESGVKKASNVPVGHSNTLCRKGPCK